MDIRDIAKHAGVSTATVSRTINHVPTVDPRLAKRVWKAIEALGYYPNSQARALVSGRSKLFGLVVSTLSNPFFPEIVQAFEDAAVEHGYDVLLISTALDPKRMELAVRRMVERRVEGVAIMTFGLEDLILENPMFQDTPLVFIDVAPNRPKVTNIRIDYVRGIRQAIQHLAALRHERIAFISGIRAPGQKSARARYEAFEQCMAEIGLEPDEDMIVHGDHTIASGMRGMEVLLRKDHPPTAVVCSNDMTAVGVMQKCYEERVAIPDEISVIGHDDIRLAQFLLPPLTTIRMSQAELGQAAFQALLTSIRTPVEHGTEHVLETNLVLRNSTALRRP